MSIGERLREERERLGFNQTVFAAFGEASLRSEIEWEKGKTFPNAKVLAAIAAAGADVQYILTGVRSENALTQDELIVLNGYRALDARGKAGVLGMIGGFNQSTAHIGQQFNAPIHQMAGGDMIFNEGKTQKR